LQNEIDVKNRRLCDLESWKKWGHVR